METSPYFLSKVALTLKLHYCCRVVEPTTKRVFETPKVASLPDPIAVKHSSHGHYDNESLLASLHYDHICCNVGII